MRLTERDREILKMVNDCRALLGSQIRELFFKSRSTAQYRLQRLYQHEYLDRHFISVISGGPASSPVLYTITRRGATILRETFDYSEKELRIPRRRTFAWQSIDHLLKLNDFRVAVILAARQHDWNLAEWWDETVFRADPDHTVVVDRRGREKRKPVYPDSFFCLQVPQGQANFFVEIDTGTEPHSRFKPQIEVYQAYTARGQYRERYNTRSLRVLVITSSATRLANLKETTLAAEGDRKYWFTTFDQVTGETVLTTPIWQRLESDELYALITSEPE
ncbi:replication-relaxation family protein [Chloroflexota bacterium]